VGAAAVGAAVQLVILWVALDLEVYIPMMLLPQELELMVQAAAERAALD
jgi:hypothetical protein